MELYLTSALFGFGRGVIVQGLINPLEVVKACYHRDPDQGVVATVRRVWQERGVRGFYAGFGKDIQKRSYKALWTWPLMTYCAFTSLPTYPRLLATGLTIAFADTLQTTQLEKSKLIAMAGQGEEVRLIQGATTYATRLGIAWCSFLVFQQYFRERAGITTQSASLTQLGLVGFQTALSVSIVTAPFDWANTRSMTDARPLEESLRLLTLRRYLSLLPLNLTTLTIQNAASVTLIHILGWR